MVFHIEETEEETQRQLPAAAIMAEQQPKLLETSPHPPPPPPTEASPTPPPPPPLRFDPGRMVGIIKRKALIKDLAAVYHAECLSHCQLLLQLQSNWDQPFIDVTEDSRKETTRPSKRVKKLR